MTKFNPQYAHLGPETLTARAQIRRDITTGALSWQSVILNPPDCLRDLLLSEILMYVPGIRRRNIEILGRQAFHAGLTLTVRAERASLRTRTWLVTAAEVFARGSGSRARRRRAARDGMSVLP